MKKLYTLFLFLLSITITSDAYSAIFSITVDSEIQTCPGVFDAKAWVVNFTASPGSTGPYVFTWNVSGPNPNQTGDTAFNIGSGSFAVTGIDLSDPNPANNAFTQTFTVSPKNVLFANGFVSPESCFGAGDGSITSLPGGGTPFPGSPSYLFSWSPSGSVNQSISSLTKQDYTVTVTDANGCTVENTFTVGGPDDVNLNLAIPNLDCSGNSITVISSPSGGSGMGYTYNWSSTPGNNSPIETGLTGSLAGISYSLTVTDSDGCSNDTTFILTEPPPMTLIVAPDTINCFGSSTGTAIASIIGGTPPYAFEWSTLSGNTTNIESNLSQGSYSVTVTDNNLCTQSVNFRIEERDELNLGLDSTDVTCNGDADGNVSGIITGGIGPYTWTANDPANTTANTTAISINSLNGGTYRITVTDNLGCIKIDSIVVNEPIALTARFTGATEPSCVGGMDGTINVSFSGGNGTETFAWNGTPFATVNRTGLTAGTYVLVITDNKGCNVTIDTTLVDPAPILGNLIFEEPKCLGGNDARVIATPSGGSGIYTNYNFGTQNGTDSILSGLTVGSYSVTITDSDGCTGTSSIVVTEPLNPFSVNIIADSVNCNGESSGGAIATPAVPLTSGPYTWLWSDAAGTTDSIVSNLAIGTYFVTTTDGNGCEIVNSILIEEPDPINTSVVGVDLLCNGDASGSASATISSGNTPYSWTWTTTPPQSGTGSLATATGLDANTKYFIIVTDREGCTKLDSITLTEPVALTAVINTQTDPLCNGDNNGQILIDVAGGTPGYTYLWNDGIVVEDRTLIGRGTYTLTVTDANNCSAIVSATLTDPNPVTPTIDSLADVSCNGFNDGFARIAVTGGTQPYTFAWPGSLNTTSTDATLAAGTYLISVTDMNSCQGTISVTIGEPTALTAIATGTPASCSGQNDGSANVSENGGIPNYTYLWDDLNAQTTATATNLIAGTYNVTVTDANGCQATASTIVTEPITITLTTTQNNVKCFGDATGDATAIPTGGSAPLNFVWSTTPAQTNPTATNLVAGIYTVTVTDANGCNETETVIITEPNLLTVDSITMTPPTCNGISDGTLTVDGIGGTPGYNFLWSTTPQQTTAQANNLDAGTFTVTVTDSEGCTALRVFTIEAPASVEVNDTNIRDASCLGAADGFIKVTPTGGTPGSTGYTHSWNPSSVSGSATDSIFGLTAGTYQDTITDNRGCFVVETYIVNEPIDGVTMSFDTTDVSCTGANNGTAKVTAIGGTPGYTYRWSPITVSGSTTDSIFNLGTGTYIVTVTDINGCTGIDSTTINPAIAISLTLDPNTPVQNVSCAGAQDGSITVITSGGVGVLGLEWYLLPNRTTPIATNTSTVANLDGGTYRILVLDGPCVDSIDVIITEPDTLKAQLNTYNPSCDGTTLGRAAINSTTGGNTGGLSFLWTPDPGIANGQGTDSIFNLAAGNYSVRVFDLQGCSDTIDFVISNTNSSFTFTDSVRNDSCNGAGNGFIEIIGIAGGSAPYSFNWNDGSGNNPRTNLIAGTYTVTISDNAGCDSVQTYIITEPNAITATIMVNPDTCGNGVGSASILGGSTGILGGTAPYTATWPGAVNGLSVSNLSVGNYNVTISDANNCQTTIPFVIGNVAPFTISFDVDSATCSGFRNGAIRVSTSASATNPISYNWSPSVPGGATPTGLLAGEYRLTVTDDNNCQAIDTVQIGEPDALIINSILVIDESCTPGMDGSATASVQGGNPPYRYNWGDGNGFVSSNSINNLVSNQYTVIVQDQKFCSSTQNFIINTSAPFTIEDPIIDSATCVRDNDGSIQINVTGAIAPITYSWPAGSGLSGSNPTNVRVGSYIVTVTDGTLCSETRAIVMTSKSNLIAAIGNKEDETCTPGADGFAVVGTAGGIEPYSYLWTPNVISGATSDSAFNLVADNYTVTVTDALSCTLTLPVTIDPAANISISITNQTPPTCFGDKDAEISIEALGGIAPYSYSWPNGDMDSTLNNVGAGIYSVTITDAATPPCIKIESITILQQAPMSVITTSSVESCNPGSDGFAQVNVTGGNTPFTFNYSGGGTVGAAPNEYTGLTAGSYIVTITDANGCSRIDNFNIANANNFTINLTKKDPTCSNGEDGEFFVNLSGGSNPFTYTWTGPKSIAGADPKNAIAGEYTILVTDAFGCSATVTDTLFNKAPITAAFNITKETCTPGNDGSATATAADGIAPYIYTWPTIPGATPSGNTISDIPAGTYNVTITDATSCTEVIPFTVGNTAPFTVTSIQNNVSCKGLSDGDITVSVTGVSTPNTEIYLWTSNVGAPNINNPNQTNLTAGSYGLTITDPGNNCIETEIFVITEPDTLVATAVLTNVSCNQGGNDGAIVLNPTGGTSPYTYAWNVNGNQIFTKDIQGLPTGTYSVIITDFNGCVFQDSYTITNLPQFTVTLDSTDVSCPGARDGFINLVTDANTPSFLWHDGNRGRLRGGLSKGMYTVTVTDGVTSCTVVDSIFINEQDSIKMTFTLSDENCFPGMDGVAQVTTTIGGTPGYTYNFSGGNPVGSDVVNQLTSGTYIVTVTDFLRCTAIDSFKINSAAAFTANFTTTDVICPGDSSGTATITTANSSGPLSFSWPLGSVVDPTLQNQSRLLAGTYEVTVTDPANGCEELLSIVINQPGFIKGNAAITAENCNPGGNGSIILATSGGDAGPYTYNWTGTGVVSTAQNQINLNAGSYFVTITDGIGCAGVDSFNVGFIVNTIPNLTTLNDGCSIVGLCAGAAQAKPTGGVAPYTFRWESPTGIIPVPASTDSIGFLCAGNYFVTITDASGCDTILPFTINAKRIILPNTLVEGETCGATDNGSISVSPTGGAEPYTYTWSGSAFSDSSQTGLAPGAYSITITDATGCDTIVNVTIDTENFDYTLTSTDLSCNGINDGTADIAIVDGTNGFTFNWNPTPASGQNTASISNLSVGTYFVTITNTINGCAVVESVSIDPNTPINPNEITTDESCFGQADGTISLGTVGGSGNYTYNWSPNVTAGTTDNATGLTAGTYDVTITDATGCDTSISVQINAANDIVAQITTNDATCTNTGICDGSAELIVTSTGMFSYTWTPGIVVAGNDSAAIDLCPGNYAVTITNAIGCSKVESFTIGGPAIIDPNFTVINSTCNISNGELLAAPTGGTGTLTVEWLDNTLTSIGTGNSINGLAAGAYFAVIVDNVSCRDTFPTSINDIGAETISISTSNNVSCFGGNDGSATVSFVCNDPSCTTEWFAIGGFPVGSSRSVSGLTAGDYYVEVTNNSGCLAVDNITITEPVGIVVSETIIANECSGGINGSITLSVSGGVGNFSYLWTPAPATGQGTNSISNLAAGTYTVVISDGNSCDSTISFDITEPIVINSTFVTTSSNCNQADGQIVATVSGGTVTTPLAYDYQWFDGNNAILVGQTSDTLRNIAAGNYRLRVIDENICQQLFNVNLSDLNGPTVVVDSVVNAGCFGENNGGVFITVTGNNSPFNYNWLPTGAVSEDIINLSEGIYAVRVTDNLGCITNIEDTVFESSVLVASITAADATCGVCNGTASVNITGGTGPYSYLWSNGETANNTDSLCGGNYTLVVTDASGCSKAFDFGVNTIGGPTGETVSVTPASCANSNDGAATVTPIGGTAPYTYSWLHNGATTNSLSNLTAGTYFVQFSDVRSCSRTVQIEITSPTAVELNSQVISSTCNQADGSILLNVTGGQPPYNYNWGTASLLDTNFLDGLPVNIYNVTVTDANGCTEAGVIPVNNTGVSFTPNPTATDVSCFGRCDGSLTSNISGVPVDFRWLDAQRNALAPINTDIQNSVCAGDYFLEITTNPEGCKSFTSVTIVEPDSITLSSSIVKDISCNGDCDGQVFINTRGGNILYTYSWSDPNSQNQIPALGLCAGTYTVTATDANGCSETTSVTLTDPPVLTGSITTNTNLICSSDCDATATSIVAGGNAPYTFTWSGGQVGQDPTDLCFGMNVLTITDARSCSITDTIFVSAIDTVVTESLGSNLVCDGGLVNLQGTVTGSSITSFGWYLADATTLLTTNLDTSFTRPVGSYTYFLIATSGTCSDTARFDVEVSANPIVNLESDIRRFGDDPTLILVGNTDLSYTYLWTPSTDLDDSTIAQPITVTEEDITYTLLVTDTNGCFFIDSIRITYSPNIDVPSGFTPNGDGTNDVWNIRLLDKFPNASVQIFNRWGTLLFEAPNGYTNPWNGEYDGEELPIGTYYYLIDFKDPALKPISGPITIIR